MGGRGRQVSEFEASLVYRANARTARVTQRNPVSKKTKKNKEEEEEEVDQAVALEYYIIHEMVR